MASLERFTSCLDYEKELPANIQIVPNEELMPAYESDYNEMKESFIYGDALKFDELLKSFALGGQTRAAFPARLRISERKSKLFVHFRKTYI